LDFIAKAGQGRDAVNQIFLLSMSGGESKQLTKAAKDVQHFALQIPVMLTHHSGMLTHP
jgi:hypothetical protein